MKKQTWDTGKDKAAPAEAAKEELDQKPDAAENDTVTDAPAAEGEPAATLHRGAKRKGGNYIKIDGQHVKQP